MNITKQFMVALENVEKNVPAPENSAIDKGLVGLAGLFCFLAVIVSSDGVVFSTQYVVYKTALPIIFITISCILILADYELRRKTYKSFSHTSLEIKELECMLKKDGLNLEKCHLKIKCDIEQQRDMWREKFDAFFHVATKGISLFVLTPMGFMFTLLFNTAYKDVVFKSASELDTEIRGILSLCGMLLVIVITAICIYLAVAFFGIPTYEKYRYGYYLSFLEDVEIYYSEAKVDNKEE